MNKRDLFFTIMDTLRIPFRSKRLCRAKYENKAQKHTISILCTGPSMNDGVEELLAKNMLTDFFAVNDFAQSELYKKTAPKYYVLLDPAYWVDNRDTNECDVIARNKTFSAINNLTTWDMTIFFPVEARNSKFIQEAITNNHVKVEPFNYFQFYPTKTEFYNYILENNWGCVPVGNVLGGALYLSINMGYNEIYLFGVEHSWLKDVRVNNNNQVCTIKKHFYGEGELEPWMKSDGSCFKMFELLDAISTHFKGYFFLDWYAKKHNVRILNCTEGSFIDSFERVKV